MPKSHHRGFTLTEMLVVIAIIAILAALLIPAIAIAIRTARNSAIGLEIKQLDTAIEAYRLEKGDYPPNFRDPMIVRRHITKCYPRIDPTYFGLFMTAVFPPDGATQPQNNAAINRMPIIDESESLVFWLSMTDTDPQFPFISFPVPNGAAGGFYPPGTTYDNYGNTLPTSAKQASPKRFYDFNQTRLVVTDQRPASQVLKSFVAQYCGDTFYVYIDSRAYNIPIATLLNANAAAGRTDLIQITALNDTRNTFAVPGDPAGVGVRPYWSSPPALNAGLPQNTAYRHMTMLKPANQTTFQIICAGQDGDFGLDTTIDADVKIATGTLAGTNFNPGGADKDNITNFSNGKMLNDLIP
jgi:prepilin-type N-terminal cleavage/methylation domain-containing protein